ncbi:MAG TPA: hypothetical protein PKY05_06830 [Fibrobacteria bacterium]|nr:hypothetical protein [Fibrobacteria bacterium]
MNITDIATNIAVPGWIAPFKIGGASGKDARALAGIYALAEGAGAAFTADVWVSAFSSTDGSTPKGLVKVEPSMTGAATTEFPAEASEVLMFDVPCLWVHINVKTLIGMLSVRGVF